MSQPQALVITEPAGADPGWRTLYRAGAVCAALYVLLVVVPVVLVFVVMFLFLQNIRYTIIPTIVVPVALLGTCAVLLVAGLSINMLTLFAMVLQLVPASLWLSLAAYAASFSGAFVAGFLLAARLRR